MTFIALLLFILLPVTEIYLLIGIGGEIGAFAVFLLFLASALWGLVIIRIQTPAALAHIAADIENGLAPAIAIGQGLFLPFAGFLLLLPGFVTDGMGIALLIPWVRRFMAIALIGRFIPLATLQRFSPWAEADSPENPQNPQKTGIGEDGETPSAKNRRQKRFQGRELGENMIAEADYEEYDDST